MADLATTDSFVAGTGLDIFRVGGSVRDELLGKKAKDADYAVFGSTLDEVRVAFQKADRFIDAVPLRPRNGKQLGWIFSNKKVGQIEVSLPRHEVSTGPGHRDFEIVVDPRLTMAEDAVRRDFTFNALYKDASPLADRFSAPFMPDEPLIHDPTGRGLYDLSHKIISTTHPDSFRDDPLRILRALRFISTLDYELGTATREQMERHHDAVTGLTAKGVSGTVFDELSKLLMGQNPAEALRVARDTGVLAVVLPELAPMLGFDQGSRYHDLTTDEHTFTALATAAHVDAPLRVRWSLLFHDSGKPDSAWVGKDGRKHYYEPSRRVWTELCAAAGWEAEIANRPQDHQITGAARWHDASGRLNMPKELRRDVRRMIENHMVDTSKATQAKVARARVEYGDELLSDMYLHRMCDLCGKGEGAINKKMLATVREMEGVRAMNKAARTPSKLGDLQINGKDVLDLGATPGPEVSRVLKAVLDEVAVDPTDDKRTRDWQLAAAGRHI